MSTPHARGRMRRRKKSVFIVAVGALVAGALAAFMGQVVAASASPAAPWLDAHKPIQARVNALLGAMTLPEKVGQMDQQLVDNLTGPSNACGSQGWAQLNQSCMKTWLIDNARVRCLRAVRTTLRIRPATAAAVTPATTGPTSTT